MKDTEMLERERDIDSLNGQLAALNVKLGTLANLVSTLIARQEKVRRLRVYTIPLDTANKEESWRFPMGTKTFIMHARNGNALRLANELGNAARASNPYFTLKAGTVYDETSLNIDDVTQTYYFACAVASEVVEILVGI